MRIQPTAMALGVPWTEAPKPAEDCPVSLNFCLAVPLKVEGVMGRGGNQLTHQRKDPNEKGKYGSPIDTSRKPVDAVLLENIRDLPLPSPDKPVVADQDGRHRGEEYCLLSVQARPWGVEVFSEEINKSNVIFEV
jgi:hypothetical protein